MKKRIEKRRRHFRSPGYLKTSHTVYRWGEYEYETNYAANHGFSLGNVIFGSAQYGPDVVVAMTSDGSASYATERDGACIQTKDPNGALYLDYTQTKMTSDFSRKQKKFK